MKKYLSIIFVCLSIYGSAQYQISGQLTNDKGEELYGATIVLLEAQDSTMSNFALTDENGKFLITDVDTGQWLIQCSYISHQTITQPLITDWSTKRIDIGALVIQEATEVLQEIEVAAEHIPMGIRGDTISYNASAFKTKPNATAEDLLKKLPGIEVKRDGSIKAMGKDVEQVLVDGKEFFGKDPKIATKNLQAEAVDKVEVFDKKSEIEEFTGIDDGQESQTINLELKEEHKNGGFGNADIEKGTEGVYTGKLNYFRYSPKVQASILASSNNINEETFTINDMISFMGGIGQAMASGSLNLSNQNFYRPQQNGINTSSSIGSNFNIDLSKKIDINVHYIYNRIRNHLENESFNQNLAEGFSYNTNSMRTNDQTDGSHNLSSKIKYKLSPMTEFSLRNGFSVSDGQRMSMANTSYFLNSMSTGETVSDFASDQNDWSLSSEFGLKKKFKKKGRNLIAKFKHKREQSDFVENILNDNGVAGQSISLNQTQDYRNELNQIGASVDLTEPLAKNLYLTGSYAFDQSEDRPYRDYFDLIDNKKVLNESLTSNYEKVYNYHQAGLNIKYNKKRTKTNLGLTHQWTQLDGVINDGESTIDGSYKNILPYLTINYKMKGNKSLDLRYFTNIIAPRLEQLLPLPNNTIPNYNYIGNPNLVPQYDHRLSSSFNLFDNFNLVSLFTNASYTNSINRIVFKTNIDDNLFRTVSPVNSDRFWSVRSYASVSGPIRPLKLNLSTSISYNYSDYNSFLNDIESPVNDHNLEVDLTLKNKNTDHIYVEAGVNWALTDQKYEIDPSFNQSFLNTTYFMVTDVYLPWGFTFSSELDYNRFSGDGFQEQPAFTIWTLGLRKLLFDDKLELRCEVFDVLNQNIGYQRHNTPTSILESNFNTINRYVSFGLNYKIGNNPKKDSFQVDIN